jgi:hypothetical protein
MDVGPRDICRVINVNLVFHKLLINRVNNDNGKKA